MCLLRWAKNFEEGDSEMGEVSGGKGRDGLRMGLEKEDCGEQRRPAFVGKRGD